MEIQKDKLQQHNYLLDKELNQLTKTNSSQSLVSLREKITALEDKMQKRINQSLNPSSSVNNYMIESQTLSTPVKHIQKFSNKELQSILEQSDEQQQKKIVNQEDIKNKPKVQKQKNKIKQKSIKDNTNKKIQETKQIQELTKKLNMQSQTIKILKDQNSKDGIAFIWNLIQQNNEQAEIIKQLEQVKENYKKSEKIRLEQKELINCLKKEIELIKKNTKQL